MLNVADLSASYGGAQVLAGISFTVSAGEAFAVLGPNGAGKSTLLRAVMALVPSISGSIRGPGGRELVGSRTWRIAREGIAYVPEGRGVLASLTVEENLLLGAGRGHPAVASALEPVWSMFPALRERRSQSAGLLSGGQQQMLVIGRALLARPKVLLLDEPSLGLAPLVRRDVAATVVQVKRSGVAVVLVEQDVTLARQCADRVVVLRRGTIAAQMTPDDLADTSRLRSLYMGGG